MAGTECARGWQANFLKPLNPILGETLQTEYSDGSKLYMEQVWRALSLLHDAVCAENSSRVHVCMSDCAHV